MAPATQQTPYLHMNHVSFMIGGMSRILKAIRKAMGTSSKTRYRLWKDTGIDQAHLSRLLTGKVGLSLENLERLADALDLEIIVRRRKARRQSKR